jgi:uncharacterized membrane protein (DUF485 family)
MRERALSANGPLRAGIYAGLAGAVLIDAYLIVTVVVLTHAATLDAFYRYVASAALGKAAYTLPQAVAIGIALHVLISVAWSLGYAYLAAQTPQMLARPLISGVAFGIFVMISMQLGEVLTNIYALPNSYTLLNAFIAHVFFFGIPVAYIVTRFETA